MAKSYTVRRSFGAKTKDGRTILVTRRHGDTLTALLPQRAIDDAVAAGNVLAYDDRTGNPDEGPEPTSPRGKGGR